jgi:hypothetical protein
MQTFALTEGAFLKHLDLALLSTGKDLRVVANRQLSGHLVSLWIAENTLALDLLHRCFVCSPLYLIVQLSSLASWSFEFSQFIRISACIGR